MTTDVKLECVHLAIEAQPGVNPVPLAKEIYEFVMEGERGPSVKSSRYHVPMDKRMVI